MTDGLLLRLDTSEAVASQQKLTAETDKAFKSLGEQDKAVTNLEKKLKSTAQSTNAVSKIGSEGFSKTAKSARDAADSVRDVGEESRRSADKTDKAFRDSSESVAELGSVSDETTTVIRKMLDASGPKGAGKSFSFMAAASRALSASVNVVATAAATAAGVLVAMVTASGNATAAYEKLTEKAQTATTAFTNSADAIENVSSGLKSISDAGDTGKGFTTAANEAERLQSILESLSETQTQLSTDIDRTIERQLKGFFGRVGSAFSGSSVFEGSSGPLKVTIDEIKELGEVLGKPTEFFRDLERAARDSGKTSEDAFKRLSDEIGIRKVDSAIVLDAVRVQELLAQRYRDVTAAAERNFQVLRNEREFAARESIQSETNNLRQEIEDQKLGNRERAATIKLREIQAKVDGRFSKEQQKLADSFLAVARAADVEAAAVKSATVAKNESSKEAASEAKSRAALVKSYEDSLTALAKEAALLSLNKDERADLSARLDVEAKAKAAGITLDKEQTRVLDALLARLATARKLDQDRTKAARESAKETGRTVKAQERLAQTLARLNGQTDVLLSSTREEAREKSILAEVEERLLRLRLERDSEEGRQVAAAVRRRADARDYAQSLQEVSDVAGEMGANVAAAFFEAANATGSFSANLGAALKRLGELEAQRAVIELLRQTFAAVGGAIYQQFNAPPEGPTTPGTTPRNQARGSIVANETGAPPVFAMSGLLLNTAQTVSRGGNLYNVAEGGQSTPEAIVPLERDRFGRLGLVGAGQAPIYQISMPGVKGAAEARKIRPTLRQTMDQINRQSDRWRGAIRGGRG